MTEIGIEAFPMFESEATKGRKINKYKEQETEVENQSANIINNLPH